MRIITLFSLIVLLGAGCTQAQPIFQDRGGAVPIASERIDLSGQGLTELPQNILGRTQTVELDVSGNRLTGALPAEIRHLRNLKVLNASSNDMTGVPAEIGQLSKLEVLILSDNLLTGLPYELGNLSKLKILDLTGNDVSSVDLEIIRAALPSTSILVDEGR